MLDFAGEVYEAASEGDDYRLFRLYKQECDSINPVNRALAGYCGRRTSFEDPDEISGSWTRELEPDTSITSTREALTPSDD